MKVSCILCTVIVVLFGILALIYALFEVNLLLILCMNNPVLYRSALSVNAVAAAFLAFWLIAFKPQNHLN